MLPILGDPCGLPYLVTEAFQGSELREILRMRGALARTQAVDFVLQATEAVAEAHRHGLCHGSLSPSTLFVTRGPDGLPMIKVLEFGSAPTLREHPLAAKLRSWTQGTAAFWESMCLWDTLAYSAPEQLRGMTEPVQTVDVWALGATLYELLVGSPAFRAPSTTALMAAIVADPAPAPSASCADLPRELEAVVLRCLSKRPEARFQSMGELAAALRPFASPDMQIAVDRVVRMQSYDPQEPFWSSSSRAIVHAGSSSAHVAQPILATRSLRWQWLGSVLFAALAAFGGAITGIFAARNVAPHAASPIALVSSPMAAAPADSVVRTSSAAPAIQASISPAIGAASAPPVVASARASLDAERRATPLAQATQERQARRAEAPSRSNDSKASQRRASDPKGLFDELW